MTIRKADWADSLAAEIVTEFGKYGHHPGFPFMLAMRLREVARERERESFDDGARVCLDAIDRVHGNAKVLPFKAVQP